MIFNETCSVLNTTTEKVDKSQLYSITDVRCERSPGSANEFYSEGDYWWPNSETNSGLPYCQRDGLSNPDNFNAHRKLLIRMSLHVAELTLSFEKSGKRKYALLSEQILYHWFLNPSTRMLPHMKYAQAVPGVCSGRGVGIIDTLHLVEAVFCVIRLYKQNAISYEIFSGLKRWFEQYLEWMQVHEYGISEKAHKNNHATCWYLQAAAFALLIDNQKVLEMCRNDFKNILLPNQMAPDGSFQYELRRTKPYCYSIFNLEVMTALCQLLSTPQDNLFKYQTPEGTSLKSGIDFLYPYLKNKNDWPYGRDIVHWGSWPGKQPCLLFAGLAYGDEKYLELYEKMPLVKQDFEAVRNTPVKNPELWIRKNFNFGS